MDKENMAHFTFGILFNFNIRRKYSICDNMNEFRSYCTKLSKIHTEGQILHETTYMMDLKQ